ncbi:MAG: Rab family GTPase [Promethearchaeia archaeon]
MSKKYILKIILAGDGGVGKTTLIRRYIEDRFDSSTKMTIGVEFFLKELEVNGDSVALQIWDFAGQPRFRFLLDSYVMGAKGVILMFDLTRMQTLENLDKWLDLVQAENKDIPILFVGTKWDLKDQIQVQDDYARQIQEGYGMIDYLKVSSKTGENVDKVFEVIAKHIVQKQKI